MSQKYTGGFITKSPVAPTTTAASGIWTLDQQQQAQKAGTWPSPPIFIEDLFSTYLYTGNGSTQTITNNIDLSGQGGLVWTKVRNQSYDHVLVDTVRGANNELYSNTTGAQFNASSAGSVSGFSSTGYSLDYLGGSFRVNKSPETYVSWTFREQPKFFDVVTYTGDGVSGRTVSHNLGSVPGFIVTKPISTSGPWAVAARKSDGNYAYGASAYAFGLNSNEQATSRSVSGLATDTTFTPASVADVGTCNNNGVTYVAYLFAHDAGGFPASGGGSTNGISCGSFVTGSGGKMTAPVNLGYEPQWLLIKNISSAESWTIYDTMRGLSYAGYNVLYPNTSAAEYSSTTALVPTATGFDTPNASGPFATSANYIYIAIRRGPMKTPTVGTSVFSPNTTSDDGNAITTGFPVDMFIEGLRAGNAINQAVMDRLRGNGLILTTSSTAVENSVGEGGFASNTTIKPGLFGGGSPAIVWNFRRAPGFFDEVCYTGNSTSGATQTHNLGVVPELMIVKGRSVNANWFAYTQTLGATKYLILNDTGGAGTLSSVWNDTAPTSTTFTLGNAGAVNSSGGTYVAYLFATCAGVSKVGSYTGNGTTQTINCGFTGGARFVIIKQTDAAGSWFTYDTARGMTVSTNPYLRLNNTAAEIATLGSVTTVSTGFALDSNILPDINFNAGTYIFLAIA